MRKHEKCVRRETKVSTQTPNETTKTDTDQGSAVEETKTETERSQEAASCEAYVSNQVHDNCEQEASTSGGMDYEDDRSNRLDGLDNDNNVDSEKTGLEFAEDGGMSRFASESCEEHDSTGNVQQEKNSSDENEEGDSAIAVNTGDPLQA